MKGVEVKLNPTPQKKIPSKAQVNYFIKTFEKNICSWIMLYLNRTCFYGYSRSTKNSCSYINILVNMSSKPQQKPLKIRCIPTEVFYNKNVKTFLKSSYENTFAGVS